jgi:hypothetical protein
MQRDAFSTTPRNNASDGAKRALVLCLPASRSV